MRVDAPAKKMSFSSRSKSVERKAHQTKNDYPYHDQRHVEMFAARNDQSTHASAHG